MLELYQIEGCPYCRRVRSRLDALGLDYIVRNEPAALGERERLFKVSGQRLTPTLVDPDRAVIIADDDDAIIAHLDREYGPDANAGGSAKEKPDGEGGDFCSIGGPGGGPGRGPG